MNSLFPFLISGEGSLAEVAWRVYEAFDSGEYEHPGEPPEFQGEARTRALLDWALTGREEYLGRFREEATAERTRAAAIEIAQRALDGQVSAILAARELVKFRLSVGVPADDPDFLTLVSIDSQTAALPLGSIRELWAPSALAEKDDEIARREAWAREVGEPAFRSILKRFDRR